MRIGCFTPLLSQFPLDKVFEKLRSLNISTVELGTGNYPGDPHCKLSMLNDRVALKDFKTKLADNGFTISALSSHGNPLHPDKNVAKAYQETSRKTILLAEKLEVPVASRVSRRARLAVGKESDSLLDQAREVRRESRGEGRYRNAPGVRRL